MPLRRTVAIMSKAELDFQELLARRRTARLAQFAKGQPKEFWDTLAAKLDSSRDGTITRDDFMDALRERDLDE